MDNVTVPLNLEPMPSQTDLCEKRLWFGNLDTRVNEYQLLKLVRVYGSIEKFDMLYHRAGPHAGAPRGFAFVTYRSRGAALRALAALNGQPLGARKMCVKFAKQTDDQERSNPGLGIPALAGVDPSLDSKLSKKTAIQCIEAKLKMMDSVEDELIINRSPADGAPLVTQFQSKLLTQHHNKPNSSFKRRHPYHRKR